MLLFIVESVIVNVPLWFLIPPPRLAFDPVIVEPVILSVPSFRYILPPWPATTFPASEISPPLIIIFSIAIVSPEASILKTLNSELPGVVT